MRAEEFYLLAYLTSLIVAVQAAIFLPLAVMFPANKSQPLLRQDMLTDLAYYFSSALIIGPINAIFVRFLFDIGVPHIAEPENMSGWRLAGQVVLALLVIDFIQYWVHRYLHGRRLWKIHSIHHCSKHVDWLSNNRSHPINFVLLVCVAADIATFLGFDAAVYLPTLLFYGVNAALVHANLNLTYGPLRYVFSSPVFHRWHHTAADAGGNKNFAAVFSFYDYIFGTFYMPKNKRPMVFGTPDPVPEKFLAQLIYPFTGNKKRRRKASV